MTTPTPSELLLLPAVSAALERSSYPESWMVNWSEEPLRYSFRGDGPVYPLAWEVPTSLGTLDLPTSSVHSLPDRLGHLLAYSALPQESRLSVEPLATSTKVSPPALHSANLAAIKLVPPSSLNLFRPVPSGGGLFPWEIYVLWNGKCGFPPGIYHYDVAHHQLSSISGQDVDEELRVLLDSNEAATSPAAALIVTAVHWKNYFKYGNACVHLHGLDSGIVSAALEILGPHLGMRMSFRGFLDLERTARLLDLDDKRESVIAALLIEDEAPSNDFGDQHIPARPMLGRPAVATPLCPTALLVDRQLRDALVTLSPATRKRNDGSSFVPWSKGGGAMLDLATALRRRRSGVDPWRPLVIDAARLGKMCGFAMSQAGVFAESPVLSECVDLMLAARTVTGLESGYYRWSQQNGSFVQLSQVQPEQIAFAMQEAYFLGNINFGTSSVIFSVTANLERAYALFGECAFRILDLAAGQIIGRLATVAQSFDLGNHAIYGFHSGQVLSQFDLDATVHGTLLGMVIGQKPDAGATVHVPCWL